MEEKKPQQIRIATIDAKGIQGSVLKGHKATLKVLHVTNNVQLLVSVLNDFEDPSPSQGMFLEWRHRDGVDCGESTLAVLLVVTS